MRVALDGIPLLIPQTGVGRYTRELGQALVRLDSPPIVNYLYGIHWFYQLRRKLQGKGARAEAGRPLVAGRDHAGAWARYVPENLKTGLKKRAARLEYCLRRPDIYHATNFIADHWDCPVVATIHDLSFIRYPQTHPQARLDWIQQGLPATLQRAHLIAVSRFTQQEIIQFLHVPEERISVIYEGLDPKFKPVPRKLASRLLDPYGLHLDWEVMHEAGQMRTLEVFLNFPVMDINRNALWRQPDKVSPQQQQRMTRFWGDDSWRQLFYRPARQTSLFGEEQEKVENAEVAEAFRQRLIDRAGFKFVPEPLPMRISTGAVVYYLFFAGPNETGKKIVTSIFNAYRHRKG